MKYFMIPYFVGCMYEGGTTEYVRIKTEDIDDFILDLYEKMDDFISKINVQKLEIWPVFKINGKEVPAQEFFFYDEKKKEWYYEEITVEECTHDDIYVVDLRKNGFSYYYFLKENSKEEINIKIEEAYLKTINKELSGDVVIGGVKFNCFDFVDSDMRFDKKGRISGVNDNLTLHNIYTKEEWFN